LSVRRPAKAYVFNNGKLNPASVYSRPALAPWYQGVNGFGQARATANQQFEYTLKQMAASPFSVNSKAYMQRIRDEYGYSDDGTYDVMGTVGGVVGAGVGAMYGSGLLRPSLKNIKFWKKSSWQNPWTGKFNPKRSSIHDAFRGGTKYETALLYNKAVDNYADAVRKLEKVSDYAEVQKRYDDAKAVWDSKKYARTGSEVKENARKAYNAASEALEQSKDGVKVAANNVADARKAMDKTLDAAKAADKTLDVAKAGSKITPKVSGLLPWVGMGFDVANLGFSVAGLQQSIEQGDTLNTILNSIAVVADTAAVVGDVLEFTPLAGAGVAISLVAGVVSIGVSAIQGWLAGQTIGHSLSPEGMKAQQLFAENLYSSMVQRPVTTAASLTVMYGFPLVTGRIASADISKANIIGKAAIRASRFLSENALGNQVRAGVSMMALQGVSSITSSIDDKVPWAPENPEDMNFVSAISLYGDINDNLYGATRVKSIMLGLVKNDSKAMVDAMSRSWGYSDDIYHQITFDDIRQGAGVELGPLGNSIVSTLGELLVDPQNYNEVIIKYSEDNTLNAALKLVDKTLDYESAKALMTDDIAAENTIGKLVDKHGLLSARVINKADRKRYLKRLIGAYLKGDAEAIRTEITNMSTHRARNARGNVEVTFGDPKTQADILVKFLDDIFKGEFRYVVGSQKEKETLKRTLVEYESIMDSIKNKQPLTDKQKGLQKNAERTFRYLLSLYGDESTPTLVNKFIGDLDLNLDNQNLNAIYTTYTDLRHHMDNIDIFSQKLNTVVNPVTGIVKNVSFIVGKAYEYIRSKYTSAEQKSVTILKHAELQKNLNNIVTTKEIDEAFKRDEESRNYDSKGVLELINKQVDSNEELQKRMNDQVEKDTVKAKEEHAKQQNEIQEALDGLNAYEKSMEESKQDYLYQPKSYSYSKKRKAVYVDPNTLPELEKEMAAFETDASGNKLSKEALEAKIANTRKTASTQRYLDVSNSLLDYKYNMKYFDNIKDVIIRAKSALKVMDTLTLKLNNDLLSIINLIGMFRVYANSLETTTDASGKTITTQKFDLEAWKRLEEELDNPDSDMTKLMLEYGLLPTYTVTKADGSKETFRGLKAIRIKHSKNIPLSFELKEHLNYSITKIIHNAILSTDLNSMIDGTVKLPDTFTKENWKKLGNDKEAKFKLIIDFVRSLSLSEKDLSKVLDEDVLLHIYKEMNKVLSQTGPSTVSFSIDELTENNLRAIVVSKIYDRQNKVDKAAVKTLDKILDMFKNINTDIENITKNLKDDEAAGDIELIIYSQLHKLNYTLGNNTAFKFIKAAFRTSYTSADNGLGLFMNNDARADLLPPYVSTKDLEAVKDNATDYVEKRIIRNYVNSPIVQEIKERQTEDFEYLKAKHNQTATQTEVDMKAEAAAKYKQRRNKNNRRKSDIKGKVKKEASKRINNFIDLTYNDISNLRIGSDLETDALFKTPYMRNMNRKRGIALLIARILNGNVKDLHLEYITYKLGASKFAAGSDSDFKTLKSYFYLLKKYNRSSSAHKDLLNVIAERIVTMIEGNKDLGLDTAKLVKLQKKHTSETDRELLIRRIVATYYKEGTIEIKAKMTHTKQATNLFSKAVYKAALNFMYNHSDIMPYQLNNKLEYEDADIEHFINRLKDEKDNSLNVARQEIFKEASSIFHDSLYSGTFSNVHNRLTGIADSLIETEQKEIRNISERYYSVATDVAKRLIFGDPRLATLLEDIIKFNEKDDKTEFGTGLFQVLHLLNEYISEDYKYKKALRVSDITRVEIDKNDRVVFTLKDSNETLTLFTLMFKYHLNIESITKIMERATVNRALGGASAKSNVELSARVRSEYNDLLNKYGGILTHNTLDIDEVAFKAQGGTDKELEIIHNVDLEILYNNMRLLDVLETNRTKNPNGKPRKTKYNRMEDYYKQEIKNIYERAISMYNNKNILNIYGVNKEKINEETAVLLHILKSKLNDKIKKNLIRNVFFDQYRVVSAIANQEHIDALQLNVDNLKKQSDKASDSSKASIEKKIKGIEKRIKEYQFRNSNIVNVEYRLGEEKAFNKFYDHILNNLEDAASYYNNRIDSDSGEFVLARTLDRNNKPTNKFVLVKHYETDGTSNVEDVSKGIPNYNMHIGENIIAKNDPNKVKDISKHVEDVFQTTAYKDKNVKVVAASNTGVVITVSKDADLSIFKNNRNNYLKELKLGTGVDVFVIYDYQYKEIASMEASGAYDVVYDYVVKMDNKGNIKGYRPNIINVKSSQTKVESYLSDLALLPKQDVDATIKALMNYAEIYNKYVIVNKSYVKNVAFNKSETFKTLLNYAKVNKAYNEFLNMLDPKGTGSFYAFNLETIANLFFRNEFIRQQSDGTYFNVSNLKYKVKKIDVLNQLQNTKVNGESLLSLIQKSIVHLQKNFGTSDINFDMRNVMSDDFETTLRTLTNQTYKILTDLRTTHNTIYNKILPRLNKKLEKNFITDYTAEEITERRRYTKTLDKDIRLNDGRYNPALLNPYGTPQQRGIRNRALKKLKASLKIKNTYGDTNETIIANESRRQRAVHKARVKSINDSRSGYARSTIRYNALLNLYNDYEYSNTLVKDEPGIHKPTKYKDFKYSKKSELKKYTDGLYEIVQDIKKQIKAEKDPQVKKELQERIARFLPKQNDNDPNGTSFALTTRDDFYDYTVSLLINEYILNVTDELVPRKYWDIVMEAIGRSGMEPDKFGPIFDKLWKEREAKRSARTYTKLDKYRKVGNGTVDIEDDVFNYLFVRDEFEPEIKELFTDVINEVEEFLFTNKTPVTPVELPKDVEYTSFKEYIDAQPVEQQEFYKFALKYFPTIGRFRALNLKEAVQKEGFMYNSEGEIVNKQGVVMDLEDHFFKHALDIKRNRKKTNKGFTGTKEVYRLLGTPILDDDVAFKDYFIKKYLFKDGVSENIINNFLREFGIDNVQQRNILINYRNLNEILEGLSGDMTIEEMYAFTMVVNMVKEQYLRTEVYKNKEFSWKQAHKEFVIDPIHKGIDALETIEHTKTFKRSAYETNIIDSIFESTNFIFESLRYVKDTNRLLGAVVVKPNEKINEVYDVNPVYVTTKESNAFSITREVGRNITEVLFQPNTTISPIGEQKIMYNRALGDAVSDFMAERNAEDINSVGPNKTYNDIRRLFTNPFKLVMKLFKAKDFIRVAEVASAVDAMINNTDNVRFYEKEFNKYMKMKLKGDVTKIDEVEKSIAEISEYFTASGYLIPMDNTFVKSVVGYILQSKYNELEVDRSKFIKSIIDFTTSQEKFKNVYKQKQLESIAYKLTPSRNPEELSEIIFGKGVNELTEEERRNFTSILDLQNFISTGTKLNPLRLYDTYDYVYENTRDIYNDESTAVLIQYRAEEEIKNIENKIRGLKGARTRISNKHNFNTDHEAVLALEATEKLVSKLLNEKETSKLKYNNAIIAKDAEKNRILNELVLNNPALIAEYIETRRVEFEKQELELVTKRSEIEKKYSKVVLDEYAKRKAFKLEYEEFFDSISFKLYNMATKDKVDAATLYSLFKSELDNMGITSVDKVSAWLFDMSKTVKDFQTKEADFKQTTHIKVDTKNINYTKAEARLDKVYKEIDEIAARLENYKTYIPQSNDDIDEQTRINIGKAYAAKILNRLNSSIKSTYKEVFKKARVEELEQVHINTIRKSVKEANEKIDQDIEKLIKSFKKHGIIPNINKGVQSIDTLLAKLDPETDKGTIAQLKGLQARVKNALHKQQHNKDILDALDNAKVISIEDLLIKSAKDVFKKNDISTKPKDIIDMVAYLAGSGTKELNKEAREAYKAQQESIKDYDDAVAERDQLNRYIYGLPEEIENLTATLELRKADLDKLSERSKKARAMSELDREYTNTNIGTYKKLHNLDPRLNDVEVLDIIVKETESLVTGDLKAIIEDAGDYELHNPVVDTLVTRLNYIAQLKKMGEPIPKEFIVLDMETVTNDIGHRVPYQMTMIKEENGKLKIVNTYINNRVFHTEDGEDMSPELAGFYKQQETILKKNNPNITDDEIKVKTDALIERVKRQPNTVEFIHTFVTELNGVSDVPIVAHNGIRFDFPNYDLFLENYARRLLTNLYYQQIKNNDPEKIRARLEESTIGILDKEGFDETLILEYQNVINKTLGKIERNEPVTIDEQKQLDKLNDAILIIRTYNSIERAELANNIIVNAELKESLLTGDYSEANKIKALVQKYVTSTDDAVRKQIYNDLVGYYTAGYALHETMDQGQEIEVLVKEMLDHTELQFKELKEGIAEIDYAKVQGFKTVRKSILESNTKGRITTTSKAYRPGENLRGHLNTIKQIEDHIKYLKGTGDNVVETINNLNDKQIVVTEERARLNAEYIKLKKELESSIANQEKAIGNIIEYARKIQDVTSNPVYNANKKIKAYVRDHSLYTDTLSNQASTGLLRLQQDEQVRIMRNKLDSLIRVRDFIISELIGKQDDSKLDEILKRENIDMSILNIGSEAERTKVIKDYKKQIKDLESLIETVDGETFFSEKLKTKILERIEIIRKASKNQVDELSTELLSRWNSDETRALLGKDFIDMKLDDAYKHSSYKSYWKILENNKHLKDDVQFIELVNLLSDRSPLFRALDLFNSKDTKTLYESSEVQELIVEGIKKDIHTLQSKIATAASIKISKDKNDLAINLLNSAFNSFLTEVKTTDSLKDTIERTDVINILSGRGRKTSEMSEETLINEAKRRLPNEVLEGLEDEHVTRVYDNILKNDDKVALILDPEKAYSTRNIMDDGSEMITVSVYDEVHDTLQKMVFSSKYPQQVTFKLTYNYTTVGRDLIQHKPKEYTFSTIKIEDGDEMDLGFGAETVHTDVAAMKKDLFKYTNKKGLRPGIKDSMIYKEDGRTDASKKAIENLLDLYTKYQTTFKTYKPGTMDDFNTHFKKFFEEVKNDQGLQLKDLKRINMTKVMERRFKQYLDVVQYAKRGDDYSDVLKVYAGLSNKLLSKFNALVPGKVLNMIPSDYSNNFTILYDDETLSNYNLDLVNSSEGSAGSSFMLRNYYTVDVPFRHSTNTVRTVLSVPKLYAKFTSIKVINDLYKLEDADTSNKDFMDLIDDLDSDHKGTLKELLVKEYNGKRINAFTPNITTDGMYDKFANDSLHKNGINVEVAFANDPRAFEDTILVDYDDAKALGWLEGNKTWLGLYGFKGAVKYIKGLRDSYGATFVAKADSINSRGAYGALLEMSLNTVRKYLIKDTNNISKEALVALRKYDKKIKALFQVTDDGKMIVDQGKDYDKLLRSIDPKLVDMLTRTTLRKNSTGTYYRASTNQIETFNVDKKILRGELYVTLDSEHTADHMAHTAEVDAHGGINYVMKDHKNSVRGGVVISPSVVYTMMAKGNVDWQKAFPADMTAVDLYANVMNFGLDYLIDNYKVEVNGVINPIKTVENIIEKTKASTLASSVNEYMFYKFKFENKLTSVEDKAYAEYRMAYLNQMIKQKSLDSMTGLHGAYYQSTYKKHPGIRQQLVANTDLGLGEVRISREGYKALIEMKQGWLQRNGVPLSDAEVKKISKKIYDTSLSDEDFAAYLNKQNVYAYVVAVRSPVQDYNAVPVIKVVGTTAHKATEANSYFYKMVGGDNDGDTIGMAAIDSEGYDALAPLDATKESYYDKEYVDEDGSIVDSYIKTVERDYKYKDPKEIKAIDARYAYVGKKTFVKGVRDHYTWDELYLITYGDRINTIIKDIDISDPELEKKLVTPELKRIYMNVLIRSRNGGYDTNKDYTVKSYFDTDVVNKFYDDNRVEILKRIIFDKQVQEGKYNPSDLITREDVKYHSETLSKEDKAYLATMTTNDFINSTTERSQEIKEKIMFNRFYNRIIYNTINRIQVSKRGVNIFGGNRKQQLVASVLSVFSKINSSPDGSIWRKLKLTTTNAKGDTIITVRSVAEGLIKSSYKIEEAVKNKTKEEFINEVKTKHLVKGIDDNSFDTNEVLGMIYDNYSKANKTQDVLSSLAKALRTKDAQELIKHFETHTIKDPLVDILVKRLKEEVQVDPKVWINNVDIQWIKTLYFGRFDDEAKSYFDAVYSGKATSKYLDGLSKQYINQHIIDRGTLNALSDKATDIIGVAKHFGIDIDPVEYLKRYTADVKALTTEASVRKVAIGEEEHALSMAIAMNKNTFERSGIRFSDAEVKTKRDALKSGKEIKLAEDYRSSKKAYTDLEKVIDDMARVEFFGDSFVTNGYYNDVKDAILEMFKIFNEERDLYRASTRLETTMFKDTKLTIPQLLLQYNVSGYRIERVLINALTTFKYINNNYHANTGGTLDIRRLSMLKDSLYFFEVLQYLHTHDESNKLKTNSDDIKYTARILLNINEVDPDLLAIDDEGNPIKIVSNDIDYNNLVYSKSMFQEALSNLSTATNIDTGTDSFKNLNKLEQKVLEETIKDLRLVTSESPYTAGDLLDKIQSEFESAKLLYEHLEGKIKDSKYNRDNPEVSKTKVANKFSFSYFNIGNSVQGITELHNKYKGVEKEILSKQKELEKIEADIRSLNNIENVLNKQEKFFKGVRTKDDMIKRLERLKEEVLAKVEVINKQMSDYAFNLNFDKATILLHTEDGRNIYNLYDSKPKMLTQKDVQDLQDSNLMNMDKYQAPFLTIIELYAIKDNNGVTIDYDWDALFKWYKENRRFNRLTIVMKAFDDETLLRKLNDLITKVDKEWEELTVDEQKQYKSKKKYEKTRARYKRIHFDDPDKLNEYVKLLNDGEETQSIRFQGKTYQGVETGLDLTQHITPTLKEIDITKASDFKAVFDFIKANGEYLIGFSDLDSVMSAMDQAYKPYRFTGRFADVIANLQHAQKLLMRYSMGFLFRNFIDTWNQLMSEMYYHKNAYGLIKEMFTPKGIVHYMGMTWNIYGAYEALSHERLTTLSLVNTKYVDIERLLDKDNLTTKDFEAIKENIEHIRNQLFNYVDTADNLTATELTNRVKNRSMRGRDLLSKIDNMLEYINAIPTDNINNIKVIKGRLELKQTVTFLLNMRFAEFFLMHNKMQPEHNKYKNKLNRISKRYQNKSEQDYEEFKHILFEINAFMQTNAQIDQYKSDEYRKLHRLVNEQKRLDTDSPIDLTYAEITKRLRQQEQTEYSKLQRLLGRKIYEHLNESIENTGRIAGFLFDRYLNGYSFNETVNNSLKRFFNYGQRSSIEMQLIADIPYLSFPIRSIDNWINRLTNPSYIRLMSDIIDGIYAQYQDEDGQYDDFTKFQMVNGWMPIMKGLGVRFGHGAFDVQNILSATGDVLDERQNPLLRGVATLIETQDAIQALKQLATIGVITRAANPLTAAPKEIRNTSPVLSIFSKKSKNSIANTFNFLFEHNDYKSGYGYKKYTPYRYRNNNGRYECYENIYKNWFNKYGRMRKPKVDPIGLVKDIQWQQYVRYRQSKSMLGR